MQIPTRSASPRGSSPNGPAITSTSGTRRTVAAIFDITSEKAAASTSRVRRTPVSIGHPG
ncbi:hypothetical protein [Methanoculleus sp.]|uniref:hypothetical protein n=1 Tax=Methanoculleus sp. TaxID=90427 RepID=UPI001BD4CBBF|nr:hypothetical protein [Methanoculleus sp.]